MLMLEKENDNEKTQACPTNWKLIWIKELNLKPSILPIL